MEQFKCLFEKNGIVNQNHSDASYNLRDLCAEGTLTDRAECCLTELADEIAWNSNGVGGDDAIRKICIVIDQMKSALKHNTQILRTRKSNAEQMQKEMLGEDRAESDDIKKFNDAFNKRNVDLEADILCLRTQLRENI